MIPSFEMDKSRISQHNVPTIGQEWPCCGLLNRSKQGTWQYKRTNNWKKSHCPIYKPFFPKVRNKKTRHTIMLTNTKLSLENSMFASRSFKVEIIGWQEDKKIVVWSLQKTMAYSRNLLEIAWQVAKLEEKCQQWCQGILSDY